MAHAVLAYIAGIRETIDTCNIGTGRVFDVEEIVAAISKIHGRPIRLNPVERLIRKVERQNLQADVARITSKYQWSPRYSLADSMEYAYEWYAQLSRT
jgi:nucleoside-diphosphate-sugar epimerase